MCWRRLIAQRLEGSRAYRRTPRVGFGSNVMFDALASSEIDVYVDYSGTLWANQMQRNDVAAREPMLAELTRWLRDDSSISTCSGDLDSRTPMHWRCREKAGRQL